MLQAGSSSASPSSRSITSAKNRWWLTTTTSASSAALRAFSTKQSAWNAQSAPRQLSRVDVTSGQIDAFSGTSASAPRSPVSRRAREGDDPGEVPRVLARGQAALGGGALEMMVADVVRAALEQRERHRELQRVADERQVALEELVLQRLGAGGDDDLAAVEQRRDEIGEGLAGAGAGFGDQRAALRDGRGHRIGHRELLRAEAEARQRAGQRRRRRPRSRPAPDRARVAPRVGTGVERDAAQFALLARGGAAAAVAALPLPVAVTALVLAGGEHGADGAGPLGEHLVGLRDARLVFVVALAGDPLELGERLEPEIVHGAQAVDGRCGWAWPRAAPTGRGA